MSEPDASEPDRSEQRPRPPSGRHPARDSPSDPSGVRSIVARAADRLLVLALLCVFALALGDWVASMPPAGTFATAALYAVLLAIPFVPGVEIGIGLLVMLGAGAAPLVWGATVTGLTLAYAVGRLMPRETIARWTRRLGRGLLPDDWTGSGLDRPIGPLRRYPRLLRLLRYRYVALAVMLNVPGNAVLGGGGGIAFAAGATRGFEPVRFVLTVAIAVAPVPLAVALGASLGD